MNPRCPAVCFIVPPHVLKHMSNNPDPQVRDRAHQALEVAAAARGVRAAMGPIASMFSASPGVKRRTVFDVKNGTQLPGNLVRGEGADPTSDSAANQAYDFAGDTYDFYDQILGRNSIDGAGMRIDSSVHYRARFNNAFWNGRQMVYGDGDGVIFQHFTSAIDVVAHELSHGVTQFTSRLEYEGESGALNEHYSDVIGVLVKQWKKQQTAAKADWLIGQGVLGPTVKGAALRSMKAPGTAYNDPRTLGRDPQPSNMKNFVHTDQDNGGVHINSGIPNKAFFNLATALGGFAWERAGKIWFNAFSRRLQVNSDFHDAAKATCDAAAELFGPNSAEQLAVVDAWQKVGIKVMLAGPTIPIKAQPPAPVVHTGPPPFAAVAAPRPRKSK